jgi:hypothetical protein
MLVIHLRLYGLDPKPPSSKRQPSSHSTHLRPLCLTKLMPLEGCWIISPILLGGCGVDVVGAERSDEVNQRTALQGAKSEGGETWGSDLELNHRAAATERIAVQETRCVAMQAAAAAALTRPGWPRHWPRQGAKLGHYATHRTGACLQSFSHFSLCYEFFRVP